VSTVGATLVSVDAAPLLPLQEWRAGVAERLRADARVVSIFGRKDGDRLLITAVLEDADHALSVLRTRIAPDAPYASLTPAFPALHCFERELHEQIGVNVVGHPWLKGIRFEKSGPKGRDAYPFYEVTGKEVHEVAVGPIHAGVIEPGSFRFMCLGERVQHLEIQLGYQHRGVEALLLARPAEKLAPIVETIAGDTSVAHAWAYAAAVEALSGTRIEPNVDVARGIMLELERVGMHLASLSGLAADVGFLQGASTYGRLRTTAINTSMRLCGSRFGRGAVRPGGVGVKALPPTMFRKNLKLIADDGALIDERFLSARGVRRRFEGVGTVPTALAHEIGLVGLAARASGVPRDLRAFAGGAYARYPISVCVEPSGDCLARARLRIQEIRSSLVWLDAAAEAEAPAASCPRHIGALVPRHIAIARVEGFRGEVVHVLETDASGRLVHYKVQDPSFRNWLGLALAVRNNDISDFPICNKSFDLSYCGNDL
jgi:Ni,Fe-hydrogenase III large subunit